MLVTARAIPDLPGANLFEKSVVDPCDGQRPLRRILTALENLATATMIAIPVDMLHVRVPYLRWVLDTLIGNTNALTMMCRAQSRAQIEPFPSVFRSVAKEAISAGIATNCLSVCQLCNDPQFIAVDAPNDWSGDVWMTSTIQTCSVFFNLHDAAISRRNRNETTNSW